MKRFLKIIFRLIIFIFSYLLYLIQLILIFFNLKNVSKNVFNASAYFCSLSLGITPYNIKGLSHQEDLVSFFKNPSPVEKLLFIKFYKYILENSQINGNFDGFFPFKEVFIFKKWKILK